MGDEHSYYPFLAFMVFTIGTSFIIGCLYNTSDKKLVIQLIMHAMGNTSAPLFPIMHMEKVPQPGYFTWVGINFIAVMVITIWFYIKHKDRRQVEAAKVNTQQNSL